MGKVIDILPNAIVIELTDEHTTGKDGEVLEPEIFFQESEIKSLRQAGLSDELLIKLMKMTKELPLGTIIDRWKIGKLIALPTLEEVKNEIQKREALPEQ